MAASEVANFALSLRYTGWNRFIVRKQQSLGNGTEVKHTPRSSKALCIAEPVEVDGLSKPFCECRLLHFECDGALLSGSLEGST
jgi:hypothetical protein